MQTREFWNRIYTSTAQTKLGWYEAHLDRSLGFIRETGITREAEIIDVGGGASTLVDDLLDAAFRNVTVLDISEAAIQTAQSRLGSRSQDVAWMVADITRATLPTTRYDLWHDRAVFHFLISSADRALYVEQLKASLKKDGHVVMATFGLAAPPKCSGLEVVRYSAQSLHTELGREFELVKSAEELHRTPSDLEQQYLYCCFRRHAG